MPPVRTFFPCSTVLTGLVLLTGCGAPPPAVDAPTPEVVVVKVGKRAVKPYDEYIGRVQAVEDAHLTARVPGFIISRDFEEGTLVEKGTVLFQLDPEEYQIAVDQAKGRVHQAEAEQAAAQRNFERAEELKKAQAIAPRDYDEAVNRRDSAKAAVEEAAGILAKAEYDLKHCTVRAPFAGRVGAALYSIGDYVSSQVELTTLVTDEPMHVYIDVNEKDVSDYQLELGSTKERRKSVDQIDVKLRLPNGALYDQVGAFDFFDNRINERTGSLKARAVFSNPRSLLAPGQFVTVILERHEAQEETLVPLACIQQDQLGPYLLIVNAQDTVEQRRVTLGDEIGVDIIVTEGLEAGERVIFEGLLKVRNGMPVKATERAAAPGDNQQAKVPPQDSDAPDPAAADTDSSDEPAAKDD